MTNTDELLELLLKVEGSARPNNPLAVGTNWHRNPEGPKAAQVIRDLTAERDALREALRTISMMHDGNPSDAMADMPIADYRAVILTEAKKVARQALGDTDGTS